MKLINQNIDIHIGRIGTERIEDSERNLERVIPILKEKYGDIPEIPLANLKVQLDIVYSLLEKLNGKTILNLGCGAQQSWDNMPNSLGKKYRYWEPWLCRTTHEIGARTIGIDGGESKEEFEYHQRQLYLAKDIFDSFQDNSLDLVCAFNLFDSPSVLDGRNLFQCMISNLEKKVKPKGFFVFESIGTGLYKEELWADFKIKYKERNLQEVR